MFTYDVINQGGNAETYSMLLDTGAVFSAIPEKDIPNHLKKRIVTDKLGKTYKSASGVGSSSKYIDRPIATRWGNPVVIRFWIIDEIDIPLIGYKDQRRLDVLHLMPSPFPSEDGNEFLDLNDNDDVEGDVPHKDPEVRKQLLSGIQSAIERNEEMKKLGKPCTHPHALYKANFKEDVTYDKLQSPEMGMARAHREIVEENKKLEIERGWLKEVPNGRIHPLECEARYVVAGSKEKPRVCFNAVTFNDCLKEVKPHIPRLDHQLMKIRKGQNEFMTKIDLSKAYFSCPWSEEQFGLLVTHYKGKKFSYTRTPFGLRDLPNHFCRLMTSIFGAMEGVAVYFDDILCYSKTLEEHVSIVNQVIDACTYWNLPINVDKCRFGYQSVEYLGMCLSRTGISPAPSKVEGIMKINVPKTLRGISQFLGMVNYNRRFLPNVTELVTPLIEIQTQNKGKFKIDKKFHSLFDETVEEIKNAMKNAISLSLIPENGKIAIYTDASEVGIGAVLGYYVDDDISTFMPVATLSKKLKGYEVRWSLPRKELYAVVKAVCNWEDFLLGEDFVIFTDHKALIYQLTALEKLPRVVSVWANLLSRFSFHVQHIEGENNIFADKLSRVAEHDDGMMDEESIAVQIYTLWEKSTAIHDDDKTINEVAEQPQGLLWNDYVNLRESNDDINMKTSKQVLAPEDEHIFANVNQCDYHPDDLQFIKYWSPGVRNMRYNPENSNETYELIDEDDSDEVDDTMYQILPDWSTEETLDVDAIKQDIYHDSDIPDEDDFDLGIGFDKGEFQQYALAQLLKFEDINLPTFGRYSDEFVQEIESRIRDYRNQLKINVLNESQPVLYHINDGNDMKWKESVPRSRNEDKDHSDVEMNFKQGPTKIKLSDEEKQHINMGNHEARINFLKRLHELAHESGTRLVDRAKSFNVKWVNMLSDAKEVAGNCVSCLVINYNKRMYVKSMSIRATCPFDCVQLDVFHPGGESELNGEVYKYVLVYADVFTGFVILTPLKTTSAKETSLAVKAIVHRFGVPRVIQTDGGSEFASLLEGMKDVIETWGCSIRCEKSAPHNSRANGRVERTIQDVRRLVNKYCFEYNPQTKPKDRIKYWTWILDEVEFGLNTKIHPVNGLSPFQLVYNRLPNGLLFENYLEFTPNYNLASYIDDALHHASILRGLLDKRDEAYAEQCRKRDAKLRLSEPLKIGSIVYYHNPKGLKYMLWEGPYFVVDHDKRGNHTIKKVKFGVDTVDQFTLNERETLTRPLDQLKVAKYLKLEDFVHWSYNHKIVGHKDQNGERYYQFRFANTSPLYDQFLTAAELCDAELVDEYESSLLEKP